MSGLNHSERVYLNPARGDTVDRGPHRYQVVGRGVAGSVRFTRTTAAGMRMQGQKSLSCWRRLIEAGTVVSQGS